MDLLKTIFFSSILCLTAGAVFPKTGVKNEVRNGERLKNEGSYDAGNDVYNSEERDLFTTITYLENISSFNGTLAWDHQDQDKWGESFPNCNGVNNSPINIRNKDVVKGGKSCLVFKNYGTEHLFINPVNIGTTVEFNGPFGDGVLQPTMSGGPLEGSYQLAVTHWHWGYDNTDGAEHALNSKKYPMEMHFVHFNTEFSSVEEALESGRPDALAVLAILFEPSLFSFPEVAAMVNTVEKARLGKLAYPVHLPINMVDRRTPYYTYLGSLTTPKCFESVRWIVYETPLSMQKDKFEVFRAFRVNGKPLVDNFRVTQQLNERELIRHDAC